MFVNVNNILFVYVVVFVIIISIVISCDHGKKNSAQKSESESKQMTVQTTQEALLQISDSIGQPEYWTTNDCQLYKAKSDSDESVIHKIERSTFTDVRDGQKYRTVKIGKFVWMAQNMNYKTNGTRCYGNNKSNCNKYGRLYGWIPAIRACPIGWHLPTRQEWNALVQLTGGEVAGKNLKSTFGWDDNGNGTDDFGFSALPGGYSSYENGDFEMVGIVGGWWSATESKNAHNEWEGGSGEYAWCWSMSYYEEYVYEHDADIFAGLSVRCIQDY